MRYKVLLGSVAALASGTAQAAWHQAQSQHFVVYADDKPENIKAFTGSARSRYVS